MGSFMFCSCFQTNQQTNWTDGWRQHLHLWDGVSHHVGPCSACDHVCFGCEGSSSMLNLTHCSVSTGIFLPVSTQNTTPHISWSTRAPSWVSSSRSCLSFTECGFLESTNTDRTLDFNQQHWTWVFCFFFLFLWNYFVSRVWGEEFDSSLLYRLCEVIYESCSVCCDVQPEK